MDFAFKLKFEVPDTLNRDFEVCAVHLYWVALDRCQVEGFYVIEVREQSIYLGLDQHVRQKLNKDVRVA